MMYLRNEPMPLYDLQPKFRERLCTLVNFGHRGSATDNEQAAGNYLFEELQSIDLEPVREEFLGCRSYGGRLLIHVAVAALGALLYWQLPLLSVILGLFVIASLTVESATLGIWLSRPLLRFSSANIVARFSSAAPRLRVILCAHYDTQRTGAIWWLFSHFGPLYWRLPAFLKSPLLPLGLIMGVQATLGVLALLGADSKTLSLANWLVIGLYAGYALLSADWARGQFVPGAADNASGAAAVLTLAENWRREPREEIELIILFPGCEEDGLLGSMEWVKRHRKELKELPTLFLNVDTLGVGPPRYFGAETPSFGWPVAYPADVIDAARETARDLGLEDAGPHTMPGPSDGLTFLKRGMRGMSIISFRNRGYMPTYHRLHDTAENLNFVEAWRGVTFAWNLLEQFTRGPENYGKAS